MTPRLYLHLDLSIERRYMDNPPRHSCLPVVYLFRFSFFVGITRLLSASVFGLVIVRDGGVLYDNVRLAPYQRSYCIVRGGFLFSFITSVLAS
jgi:hypothetical protein